MARFRLTVNPAESCEGGREDFRTRRNRILRLIDGGRDAGAIGSRLERSPGTGIISVNGGAGSNLQAVAVAVGASPVWSTTNLFSGGMTAAGGAGTNYGGAGTIYLNSSFLGNGSSKLIVDIGGSRGTNSGMLNTVNGMDVLITNGAALGVGGNWNHGLE